MFQEVLLPLFIGDWMVSMEALIQMEPLPLALIPEELE